MATYILTMGTTIQISKDLMGKLKQMKMHAKESYEEIIWDLLEDRMEFSDETKKNIVQSEKEFKEGKTHKWEDVKKELRINV